jgi:transposase
VQNPIAAAKTPKRSIRDRRSVKLHTAIEAVSQLRFLPPYSPDFKPIELAFAKLKALIRAARLRTFDHVCRPDRRRAEPLHSH